MPYLPYNYLPGVVVNILDGGLISASAPKDDAILVIGTAGQGVSNSPYQVTDRSVAASEFGFLGSLEKAIEECATYSDNIIAFRMGTTPMVLSGVGVNTGGSPTPGFSVQFGTVEATSASQYSVWYANGVFAAWLNGEIVYSNQSGAAVDTSDLTITGTITGNTGLVLGTGSTPTLAGAVTVTAAAATSSGMNTPTPTISQSPVDGTSLTGRQLYVALRLAMDLLEGIVVKIVYAPDAVFNARNVAYYVASDATTTLNNPVTNTSALDWLLTTPDGFGGYVYQWASETTNSAGGTVTAYGGLTYSPTGSLPSVITASTLSVASTLTLTAVNSADTLTGTFDFRVGTAGTAINVTLAASTITAATTAITTAIAAASVSGVTAAHSGAVITITGTADTGSGGDIAGHNTFSIISNTVQDIQTAIPGFATVTARQAAGFMEVNFGCTLGNFCADLSQIGPLVVSVIGTTGPTNVTLSATRQWIGYLPTLNTNGDPATHGSGLLGTAYLTGTTSTKMNPLCADYVNGFRLPGLYVTEDGSYDGIIEIDANGNPIDAGKHVHVVADYAFLTTGWAANYVSNIAGITAGLLSSLDATTGLTNTQIKATQIWQPTPPQMDALTQAKISVLRYKGVGALPALLHDLTAGTNATDYTNFVRVRCMGVVVQQLFTRANSYLGRSSLDGLTLVAMVTQLNQDLVNLTTRGYCNHSSVTVTSTSAQQKIGHCTLNLKCHPADELIQISASIAVGS